MNSDSVLLFILGAGVLWLNWPIVQEDVNLIVERFRRWKEELEQHASFNRPSSRWRTDP